MTPLLGKAGLAALAQFVRRDTLLAFDYDGTLAPIVPDPARARMRPETHRLLDQLTRRFPTVIITGRSRLDLLSMIPGITSLEVIGNHGLETDGVSGWRYTKRVEEWRARAAEALRGLEGVVIENKRYSLAVHYRHCSEPEAARQAILRLAGSLRDVRVVGGKAVVNLIPAEAPDKGRALLAALTRLGCGRAIYLGDDDTDEDVFGLERDSIFTVRVGRRADSSARYYVPEQADVDRVLEALLELAHPAHPPETGAATA